MKKSNINPELKKKLDSLRDVPERDLQSSYAGKEAYLVRVKNMDTRRVTSRQIPQGRTGLTRRSWAARLATLTIVIVVALSSLGGTVYAAQAAQPDDLLYGVKTLTEEIQVSLERDPEEKLSLYVSFANRRIQEIQAQVAAGEEVSQKALDLLEKHTQKMLRQATKLQGQGMENALRQIEKNLQKQNQMMSEAGKQHPQGGPPGLLKAQDKIRERMELIENGLNEPQGFKEEIRQQEENSDSPDNGKDKEKDKGNGSSNKPDSPPGQDNKDNPGKGNENGIGKNGGPELTVTPESNQ